MIRRLIILTILIGPGAITHLAAQGGFNLTYENPLYVNNSIRFDHITLSKDTLTVIGTYGDDSIQAFSVIVAQFDTMGNIFRSVTVKDTMVGKDYITEPNSVMLVCRDGGIAVPAVTQSHAMLIKLNSSFGVDFISEFDLDDRIMVPMQIIETTNGYLLLGWIQRLNYNIMTFVVKTDYDGNEIWRKYYGYTSYNQWFDSAVKISENEFVIGSGFAPPFSVNTPEEDKRSTPWMFAIDSTGAIIWQWVGEEHEGEGWGIANLKKTIDGGYVYNAGLRHSIDDDNSEYTPMLIKRDSLMNLEWERDYNEGPLFIWSYFSDIQILDNDEIVMAGVRGQRYNGLGALVGRVVKASDLGEQTWEATDTGLWSTIGTRHNYFTGIAVSQTGSIYACGRTRAGGPKTLGWLVKITADGCIDTLCMTTSLTDLIGQDAYQFNIYPNPSQGRFTIEADQQSPGDYIFAMYDMYGRLVIQKRLNQTASISRQSTMVPGIYVYVIRNTRTGRQLQSGKMLIK